MDATEDNSDVKLYKASGSLLTSVERKLPRLIYKSSSGSAPREIRRYVLRYKSHNLSKLLEQFQEWPQLLDPKLPDFISLLNDAFLTYVSTAFSEYLPDRLRGAVPLPRTICELLYLFCKIRGQKVIVRFLSNEPRHLQSMINAFKAWSNIQVSNRNNGGGFAFSWEEKYVMLLWLSHLMLIPFDLTTASYGDAYTCEDVEQHFSAALPPVAISVLTFGLENIGAAGKEREAAAALLVRLALRPDMRKAGVLDDLVRLVLFRLEVYKKDSSLPVYHLLGTLSVLSGLFSSGSDEDVAPFISKCFRVCHDAASTETTGAHAVNSSANSRKLLIKILRSIVLKAILLESRDHKVIDSNRLAEMLEDVIDYLLAALADKDTPIRFAASKALSMITLKLDVSMAADIVDAVIGSLGENLLYEKPGTGKLVVGTALNSDEARGLRPNMTAVDAMRWQGLMLTLAHLLYRRCPPTDQLPEILKALLSGLDFEQRTSTGVSVGTGVRDAACFGLWALSRKYSTAELKDVDLSNFKFFAVGSDSRMPDNVIQIVCCHLVASACLDPSGNIRRGSSAALQELIGRHPDTVEHGIAIVQAVDYHAVARRSRAVLEVAISAAKLSPMHHSFLVEELMEWRGIKSADADSRRTAAAAIGVMACMSTTVTVDSTMDRLVQSLEALPTKPSGSTLELRHGLLLALSSTIFPESFQTPNNRDVEADRTRLEHVILAFHDRSALLGEPLKRSIMRSDLMYEAISSLITSLCNTRPVMTKELPLSEAIINFMTDQLTTFLESDSDIVVERSSEAVQSLFKVLADNDRRRIIHDWLDGEKNKRAFSSKGRISALGAVVNLVDDTLRSAVIGQLQDFVVNWPVEIRTTALRSLSNAQADAGPDVKAQIPNICAVLRCGLSDYTTDQRGDIGSIARLEAIRYTKVVLEADLGVSSDGEFTQQVIPLIARLAAEKLDKVRYQAWVCLQIWWKTTAAQETSKEADGTEITEDVPQNLNLPTLVHDIQHVAETSSTEYFLQLLSLTEIDWLRQTLLQGLISSASAGTEAIIRATREALIIHIRSSKPTQDEDANDTSTRDREHLIFSTIVSILEETLTNDRYAIPAIEMIGFLLTQDVAGQLDSNSDDVKASYKKAFQLVQKAHFKSSNVPRLEVAVKAYEGMLLLNCLKKDVVRKLVGMLLHPYPKIRNMVADTLFIYANVPSLRSRNWSASPKELKPHVEALRTEIVPS